MIETLKGSLPIFDFQNMMHSFYTESLNTLLYCVCVECLIGKQNKPTPSRSPSRAPYRTGTVTVLTYATITVSARATAVLASTTKKLFPGVTLHRVIFCLSTSVAHFCFILELVVPLLHARTGCSITGH